MKFPKYFVFKAEADKTKVLLTDISEEAEVVEVFCKDCAKHNVDTMDYLPDKRRHAYVSESCPLVAIRGKAKGHEFDYQYCSYGRRKDE